MTDREALLAGIMADPLADLPRLVFADWLDDNGTTDLDRATSEYIRLGCGRTEKGASRRRRTWFKRNWTRLVPAAIPHLKKAESGKVKSKMPKLIVRSDRVEAYDDTDPLRWQNIVYFEFDKRGFLAVVWSYFTPNWINVIRVDQPLAEIDPIPF